MGRGTTNQNDGQLGMALDALRGELGLTIADLADRTDHTEADLYDALNGLAPAVPGLVVACLRAMADVLDYENRMAASA